MTNPFTDVEILDAGEIQPALRRKYIGKVGYPEASFGRLAAG
jgi:hypothetical protein